MPGFLISKPAPLPACLYHPVCAETLPPGSAGQPSLGLAALGLPFSFWRVWSEEQGFYGWNLKPVGIYHCRVRHRPVLDVGLEAKASNFSLVAFVYSAEDLKATSVLLQGSQRLVMPQAGCKQGMLRLMHKAVLNNFSSCPEETGLCSLLLHTMHSNGRSSAAPLPSLTSYTQ